MRHGMSGRKFNRSSSHRKALLQNLAKALLTHEHITTTLPKAKDLRPFVEKLVTLGREDTLHTRRQAIARLGDVELVKKLFSEISPRFAQRPGGYLRIVKAGFRYGDSAPMAVIQFVERSQPQKT